MIPRVFCRTTTRKCNYNVAVRLGQFLLASYTRLLSTCAATQNKFGFLASDVAAQLVLVICVSYWAIAEFRFLLFSHRPVQRAVHQTISGFRVGQAISKIGPT